MKGALTLTAVAVLGFMAYEGMFSTSEKCPAGCGNRRSNASASTHAAASIEPYTCW
jgi:hypothetical protein